MLICEIYLKDIDYNSVAEKLMPIVSKALTDKDNIFYTILKKIISINNKPSALTKFLVSIVPNKDDIAVSILQQYNEDLVLSTNEILRKNNLFVNLKTLRFRTIERNGSKMIKVEIVIDDIDYEKTIVNQLPQIINKLNMKDGAARKAVSIMTKNSQLIENMIKAAIREIPKEKRDEFLAGILMEFRKEFVDTANQMIRNNDIKAEIKNIAIEGK